MNTKAAVASASGQWERLLASTFLPGQVRGMSAGRMGRQVSALRVLLAELSLPAQRIEHGAEHLSELDAEQRTAVLVHVVLEGRGFIEQHGRAIAFGPGDVSFRHCASPSRVVFETAAEIVALRLPISALGLPEFSQAMTRALLPKVVSRIALCVEPVHALLQGLHGAQVSAAERDCALAAVPWLVAGAFHGGTAGAAGQASRWRELLAYVDAQLFEPEALSVNACATAAGISARYVHKLFARHGLKFSAFVRERRLEAARALLSDPAYRSHSIASVAYQCGFASAAHFSRAFRDRFAMTPGQCRRAAI